MSKMPVLSSPNYSSFDAQDREVDPVLPGSDAMPSLWTEEMLTGLDWRKLVEVARALAVSTGYEPGGTRIWPDGMTEFAMTKGQGSGSVRSILRTAPWSHWVASGDCIEKFSADLASKKGVRGVYLAPGGISPTARIQAAQRGIEVVDAEALAAALNALPSEHSEYFHDLTLCGQPFVPSCPVCLRSLSQTSRVLDEGMTMAQLTDRCYATSDIVAERVLAGRVEILPNCEVHFLREVRAKEVLVRGVVYGNFVCEGSLEINPGAVVHGNVAARSVFVRPGAALHGETRILQGNLGSVENALPVPVWLCENLPARAGCERILFLQH